MAIIKIRQYSVLLPSSFALLSCNLRTVIHLKTAWQKMGTANIAELQWRHIQSKHLTSKYMESLKQMMKSRKIFVGLTLGTKSVLA